MRTSILCLTTILTITATAPAFAATARPARYLREQSFQSQKSSSSSSTSSTTKAPRQRALLRQKQQEWKDRAEGKSSSKSSSSSAAAGAYHYEGFRDDFLGNGQQALLYFYAPWSRQCQGYDKIMKGWSNEKAFKTPLYRVEYDDRLDLRTKFGVKHANSFLLVNGKGEKVEYFDTLFEAKVKSIVYQD